MHPLMLDGILDGIGISKKLQGRSETAGPLQVPVQQTARAAVLGQPEQKSLPLPQLLQKLLRMGTNLMLL